MRIAYADRDRSKREALREMMVQYDDLHLLGTMRDGAEAVQLAVQYKPDVMILNEDLASLNGYEAAELIGAAVPQVKVLLLVDRESPEVLQRAMQTGIRQCMTRPISTEELLAACRELTGRNRILERDEYQSVLDPKRFPKIIAVTGAKGGIGKTSLSVNLAVALSKESKSPTCLFDSYTQFGDVAAQINIRPPQTLVDLTHIVEFDTDVLDATVAPHPCGLHVILGSLTPHPLDAIPASRMEEVLAACRKRYRFIVIDVPNLFHAGSIRLLESAHHVMLVCNLMDITTVSDTRRWLESIENSIVPRDRIHLVLNRVGKENHFSVKQVEQAVRIEAWGMIPNDFTFVSQSANKGVPCILQNARNPFSVAVTQLAYSLIEDHPVSPVEQAAQTVVEEKKKSGFLGLSFGRSAATIASPASPPAAELAVASSSVKDE